MKKHHAQSPGWARPPLHVGDLRVSFLNGGRLKLDGGAMFGIIPKPLWQRLAPADELNRIELTTTCLLVETAGRRIIVESGIGNKYEARDREIFALSETWLLDSLRAVQIDPESIDVVILTHLHFDHAGGGTFDPDGRGARPTFPRARYIVPRGEWDDSRAGYFVMTATYREENLAPLERAGLLELVDGEAEVAPGVSVRPLPGHTRHQQGVLIHHADRGLLHVADLIPTAAHLGLRYNMAYDLLPYENMRTKQRVLEECAQCGWTVVFGQDPHWSTWRISKGARGFEAVQVE